MSRGEKVGRMKGEAQRRGQSSSKSRVRVGDFIGTPDDDRLCESKPEFQLKVLFATVRVSVSVALWR